MLQVGKKGQDQAHVLVHRQQVRDAGDVAARLFEVFYEPGLDRIRHRRKQKRGALHVRGFVQRLGNGLGCRGGDGQYQIRFFTHDLCCDLAGRRHIRLSVVRL